ncbi:anthranilate synthase component I family protein [uncultured Schumannella sp.]|uniref:anthranilate synthase component I family protein n=1 Tax=uncultured Schumannella sp. TaxID=1195956 RepID=UPI0025CD8CE4|nr:anthranilate synthase component I family protein [uncultured Schumannella sp.]
MRPTSPRHELAPRRVLEHPVGIVPDAAAAFRALVGEADGFWLDSAAPEANGATGTHYLGRGDPVAIEGSVLEALRAELASDPALARDGLPAFRLGLVGWLEYELRFETLGLPRPVAAPPAALLRVDRMLVIDAASGEGRLVALGADWTGELAAWRDAAVLALADLAPAGATVPAPSAAVWRDDDARYLDNIRACQEAIREGEAYQLCLTTRVELPGVRPDPVELLTALRATSPSHHGGLIRIGERTLVSASPERFLRVDAQGRVDTSPIKGTRPRGADAARDAAARAELLASEKERAENLMIVDLMRNDLSRVCEVGSVAVTHLLEVESYAQVHQLVSTVEGQVRAGLTVADVVAACFPAGSMTGAPKRRATEILDELEGRPRGIYAGAFGWFGYDGACDLAMVIRSIVLDAAGASLGTGGGITALSDPAAELAEIRVKAAPLLRVLGAPAP